MSEPYPKDEIAKVRNSILYHTRLILTEE
jgi:hypothetical protein